MWNCVQALSGTATSTVRLGSAELVRHVKISGHAHAVACALGRRRRRSHSGTRRPEERRDLDGRSAPLCWKIALPFIATSSALRNVKIENFTEYSIFESPQRLNPGMLRFPSCGDGRCDKITPASVQPCKIAAAIWCEQVERSGKKQSDLGARLRISNETQ